jgi:cytochrome c oxidase assembly factor CtaG
MGTWFFWPILAPKSEARLPPFAAIAYLFTACTACTILGIAVTFSPVEICTSYLFPSDRLGAMSLLYGWGLTPQRDQQIGGLLMWLPACLVYGAGILGILARGRPARYLVAGGGGARCDALCVGAPHFAHHSSHRRGAVRHVPGRLDRRDST